MTTSDLQVDSISDALSGMTLDVIVSGSIGAVEAVRFIRALRRLGARVVPWLTSGGEQFVTEIALSWAADHPVHKSFSGTVSHLATGAGCIVAPASANFVQKIAAGTTDTAPSALVASYLGQKKPVLVLPNMHDSLATAPAVQRNLATLQTLADDGCRLLNARAEEGKQKFPAPDVLAAEVAHSLNRRNKDHRVLVTMGTTRGYLDDIRYLSNYSSGALGSAICEELYMQGFATEVVCGPCPHTPRFFSRFVPTLTTDDMAQAVKEAAKTKLFAAIFAASVLDYTPIARQPGKIRSGQDQMTIICVPTQKIIGLVAGETVIKVGFKLEPSLSEAVIENIAREYQKKYQLKFMVLNALADVSAHDHKATLVDLDNGLSQELAGKQTLARELVRQVSASVRPT